MLIADAEHRDLELMDRSLRGWWREATVLCGVVITTRAGPGWGLSTASALADLLRLLRHSIGPDATHPGEGAAQATSTASRNASIITIVRERILTPPQCLLDANCDIAATLLEHASWVRCLQQLEQHPRSHLIWTHAADSTNSARHSTTDTRPPMSLPDACSTTVPWSLGGPTPFIWVRHVGTHEGHVLCEYRSWVSIRGRGLTTGARTKTTGWARQQGFRKCGQERKHNTSPWHAARGGRHGGLATAARSKALALLVQGNTLARRA